MSADTSTIQQKAIQTVASLQEQHSRIYQMIGFAQYVV